MGLDLRETLIVVGSLVVGLLCLGVLLYACCWRKKKIRHSGNFVHVFSPKEPHHGTYRKSTGDPVLPVIAHDEGLNLNRTSNSSLHQTLRNNSAASNRDSSQGLANPWRLSGSGRHSSDVVPTSHAESRLSTASSPPSLAFDRALESGDVSDKRTESFSLPRKKSAMSKILGSSKPVFTVGSSPDMAQDLSASARSNPAFRSSVGSRSGSTDGQGTRGAEEGDKEELSEAQLRESKRSAANSKNRVSAMTEVLIGSSSLQSVELPELPLYLRVVPTDSRAEPGPDPANRGVSTMSIRLSSHLDKAFPMTLRRDATRVSQTSERSEAEDVSESGSASQQ